MEKEEGKRRRGKEGDEEREKEIEGFLGRKGNVKRYKSQSPSCPLWE